jgi:hypothetical protein
VPMFGERSGNSDSQPLKIIEAERMAKSCSAFIARS